MIIWNCRIQKHLFIAIIVACCLSAGADLAQAETYYHNDFNGQDAGALALGSDVTISPSGGRNGSPALCMTYDRQGVAGHWASFDLSTYKTQELWVELDVRIQGEPAGGMKFVKFFGNWNTHSQNNMTLGVDPWQQVNREVSYYGDTICVARWDGGDACPDDVLLPTHIVTSAPIDLRGNSWNRYKAFVKRADQGQKNGEVKIWFNGILRAHIINMDSNPGSVLNPTYFEGMTFGDYANERTFTSTWYFWMDNLTVSSTDPDGGAVSVPAVPAQLTVE